MLSYIYGNISEILDNAIIIEANGIGYHILTNSRIPTSIKINENIKIFTQMIIKENDISIVGFLDRQELEMFNMLTSVSGVGTKAALSIQSIKTSHQIMLAILSEEIDEITKAQGIGKKMAAKIILELKDKLKSEDIYEASGFDSQQNIKYGNSQARADATDALLSLGYSKSEALRAIMEIKLDNIDTQQIIKLALKTLNK